MKNIDELKIVKTILSENSFLIKKEKNLITVENRFSDFELKIKKSTKNRYDMFKNVIEFTDEKSLIDLLLSCFSIPSDIKNYKFVITDKGTVTILNLNLKVKFIPYSFTVEVYRFDNNFIHVTAPLGISFKKILHFLKQSKNKKHSKFVVSFV